MMNKEFVQLANQFGFEILSVEKVIKLSEFLEAIFSDEYLRDRLVLKGGTALNFYWFNLPRLSVDIDLNYIGSLHKDIAIAERPYIHEAIYKKAKELGFHPLRTAKEYAGGKLKFEYLSSSKSYDNLALDINYIARVPLFPVYERKCCISSQISHQSSVKILDFNEIVAGKIAALLSRDASRDVFDLIEIFSKEEEIDLEKLRIAMTVYLGISRSAKDALRKNQITIEPIEYQQKLLSLLPFNSIYRSSIDAFRREAIIAFNKIPNITDSQKQFLEILESTGEIKPELVSDDQNIQYKIINHPGILWKSQNVREYNKVGSLQS